MNSLICRLVHLLRYKTFSSDNVNYKGITLPAKHLRFCGKPFRDDEYFLSSARGEVNRLTRHLGLTRNSSVLDVGCGVGRLPIGILSQIGEIRCYRGVDVSKGSIQWCQRHIAERHPTTFQFTHIDVKNLRYNPAGNAINNDFRFPFKDSVFDIIYLYSVFTHMTIEDIKVYLKEFQRLLAPSGKIFLTAFVEEGVPDMTINPQGYKWTNWSGPLHCVRYNKKFFEEQLAENLFGLDHFEYERDSEGHSALYISKINKRFIAATG